MDKIEFRLSKYAFPSQYIPCDVVEIFINDISLKELLPSFERHAFLTPTELVDELTKYYKDLGVERCATILGCVCGFPPCDPVYVKIDESEDCIIWHSFHNEYIEFTNRELRPFVFDKMQYFQQIEILKLWAYEDFPIELQSSFSFNSIQDGFLYIDFYKGMDVATVCFDECLSDPVPEMVKMYMKLKINEDATFAFGGLHDCLEVSMTTRILDADEVQLVVIINDFCEDKCVSFIDEQFDRGVLLNMFEKLFRNIVLNIDYPYQYPCHSGLNVAEYDSAEELFTEHVEYYPEDNNDEYHNEVIRENVSLTEDGKIKEKMYTRMIKELIIPESW